MPYLAPPVGRRSDLSNSALEEVGPDAFTRGNGTHEIVEIRLSYAPISDIDENAFRGLTFLSVRVAAVRAWNTSLAFCRRR